MKDQSKQIKRFLIKHVSAHPQDIATYTSTHFGVTRTTVHRHLSKLIAEGAIIKSGTTKQAQYFLSNTLNRKHIFTITHQLSEMDVWVKYFTPTFSHIKSNLFDICEYAFTEIFNNAIDHSNGSKIIAESIWNAKTVKIIIQDNGIGIFKKLKDSLNLSDLEESILELTKGKVTTDPARHTGEGIFFSSKCFDVFSISANNLIYVCDNKEKDWFLETESKQKNKGTKVTMEISLNSPHHLTKIFESYQEPETLEFNRTKTPVKLCQLKEERYISRSQAKRLVRNLDKFEKIVFDFKGVKIVGQGFVDEVFRVFQNQHPHIQLEYTNANKDVEFMIKRGIPKN